MSKLTLGEPYQKLVIFNSGGVDMSNYKFSVKRGKAVNEIVLSWRKKKPIKRRPKA